jgi:hypothetical protein
MIEAETGLSRSRSGGCGGGLVGVELEEVVGGGDQPPFGVAGGSSAALEAVDPAVELGVAEDGLDHALAFAPRKWT